MDRQAAGPDSRRITRWDWHPCARHFMMRLMPVCTPYHTGAGRCQLCAHACMNTQFKTLPTTFLVRSDTQRQQSHGATLRVCVEASFLVPWRSSRGRKRPATKAAFFGQLQAVPAGRQAAREADLDDPNCPAAVVCPGVECWTMPC